MSSIVVAGDTSGSVTLQAPAVAGSNILSLPAVTATVITDSAGILNIGSGQVYKDSSGNVGIGTSSPTAKLSVAGNLTLNANYPAWNVAVTAMQASTCAIWTNSNTTGFAANIYYDSTYTRRAITTNYCGELVCSSTGGGGWDFNVSGSTTAGATVAMNTAMRIDSSGNLLVGTTSSAGAYKLQTSTDAYINGVTIGRGAGNVLSNSVLGNNAGSYLTTGVYNTCIGYLAGGANCTSIQGATYIGAAMQASSATANYEIAIGFNLVGKGSATFYAGTNGGGSYNGANATTWATTSDQRLKKNIVDNNSGLNLINQIQVRNFEYRLPEEVTELPKNSVIDIKGVQLGVIAQEMQQILPDCVKKESTGVLSVQSDSLTWYMVNAIKELKAIIDMQQEQINSLLGK